MLFSPLILIVSLFIIAINSYSQEFMGIKVEGTKKELIDKFEQKNFWIEESVLLSNNES